MTMNSAPDTPAPPSRPAAPAGAVRGCAWQHTPETMAAAMENAWTALPAAIAAGEFWEGLRKNAPKITGSAPSLIFIHGSGGINPQIRAFMAWCAQSLGIACLCPDSFQLPDRMTYSSPIPQAEYEKIHALRSSELTAAVAYLARQTWFDGRFVIAGTSEGGVAVARYIRAADAPAERGRIIYSWSCEPNYHVAAPQTAVPEGLPVLNVMSLTDAYFSRANAYLGNPEALGHAGAALADDPNAAIVLIPQAPHTLMNLPQARAAALGFLRDCLLTKPRS